MSIIGYRSSIIEAMRAGLPMFNEVASCPSRFNEESFTLYAVRAPALRVAWIGAPKMPVVNTGEFDANMAMAAFVIAVDEPLSPAEDQVLTLAEEVATFVSLSNFGLTYAHPATVTAIENLHTATMRGKSLAAVSFTQVVRMGVNLWEKDFDEGHKWMRTMDDRFPEEVHVNQKAAPTGPHNLPPWTP